MNSGEKNLMFARKNEVRAKDNLSDKYGPAHKKRVRIT